MRALTASMTSFVFTPLRATTTPPTASLRALDQRRHAKGVADLHVRDLLDVDRHAVRGADDDLLDVVDRCDQPDAAHDQPGAVRLEDVAADIQVAVAHGGHDGAERQVVGAKPIGIDVDLVLLDVAADGRDFGDAGHGVELIADEPVLQACADLAARASGSRRVYQKTWPTPVASGPSVGATPAGRRLRDQAHALEHARPREIQVDVVLEDDVDHREPERRLRPDDAHAGQALQVHGQRIRDLVLDLLRAVARPVREDDDLVVGQIGNGVDRRRAAAPTSPSRRAPTYRAMTMNRLRSESSMSRLIMRRHSSCGGTHGVHHDQPGHASGQTHDDCQWLDEEDGEQEMLSGRTRRAAERRRATPGPPAPSGSRRAGWWPVRARRCPTQPTMCRVVAGSFRSEPAQQLSACVWVTCRFDPEPCDSDLCIGHEPSS